MRRPTPVSLERRRICLRRARVLGRHLLVLLATLPAQAGGGPANVAVVVNADSWASLTVANEFVHLRKVPPANVVYLRDLPGFEQTTVDLFRERILRPSLKAIQDRGLAHQIDYLVYSCDVPYRINVSADTKDVELPKFITPWASVNGLTYLYGYVLGESPAYLSLGINRYARRPEPLLAAQGVGEDQREAYVSALKLMEDKKWPEAADVLRRVLEEIPRAPEVLYNLACCLAREGEGDQAVAALEGAAAAGYLNFAHMGADEDLESLREREDFQGLVERMKNREFEVQPTRGFRRAYMWDDRGEVVKADAPSYLLSTVLGVTSGRGNSVREVIEGLRRSAAADGTNPSGTVYYMVNSNVRSLVRQWGFRAAVASLTELGVSAESVEGALPQEKADVQGLMAGSATLNWAKCKSRILPGAICEHLTSCGGMLYEGAGQTPLTDFIRAGAAAASGAVTEPYAIPSKFPDPFIHVHYARGCSLAEAFYQSLPGPYQLLIVGDPLCRPWARIPVVTAQGIEPGEAVSGRVSLHPRVQGDAAISHYELLVEGRRQAACAPGGTFDLDTSGLCDGYHELRVVAVVADLIETQGELVLPVRVSNHGHRLQVTPAETTVAWGQPLRLQAELPGGGTIAFAHNRRVLATVTGSAGQVEIDSRQLGLGTVQLQALGLTGDDERRVRVTGEPIELNVVPPPALAPVEVAPDANWAEGIELTPEGGDPVAVASTREKDWLAKAGMAEGGEFALVGYFDVPAEDMYQLQVRTDGQLTAEVDGTVLVELDGGEGWRLLPVALAVGTHRLACRGVAGAETLLDLRFGGPGALSVGADRFRHVAPAGQ